MFHRLPGSSGQLAGIFDRLADSADVRIAIGQARGIDLHHVGVEPMLVGVIPRWDIPKACRHISSHSKRQCHRNAGTMETNRIFTIVMPGKIMAKPISGLPVGTRLFV